MKVSTSCSRPALGALLVLVSGAAVAGALASTSARSPIQQALDNTYRAGTNRFDMSLAITSGRTAAAATRYTVSAKGAFDFRHSRGFFTVDTGRLFASLNVKIGSSPLPRKIDMVVVGNVLYVHLPALRTQNPGVEWLKVDPGTLPRSMTQGTDVAGIVSALNPLKALTILGGATSFRTLGTQTIGGTPMTRYRVVIDAAKLARSVGPAQRAQVSALLKQLRLTTITMDTWLDGRGYVRRIVTAPTTLTASAAATTLLLTMNFSAYGNAVEVSAPPARACVDAGRMLAGLGAGSSGSG